MSDTTPAGAVVTTATDSKPTVQSSVIVQCLLIGIPAAITAIVSLLSPPYNWPLIIATGTAALVSAVAGVLRGMSKGGTEIAGVISSPK
jgi:hypothetical protein